MHSIVRGTGTPKDRTSYILFEYIDPAEVGADIRLAEVELRKPRNLLTWQVYYYESLKRELKTKTIYGYRCDERLKTNVEESTRLTCTPLCAEL